MAEIVQDISLFNRLKRLFSSDVILRNIGGKELKVLDINKIQRSGKYQTNSLVDRFSRLYIYNNKNLFNPNLNFQTLRIQLYSDYEAADTDPIISSALDIVADECLLRNDRGEMLTIKSSDENIKRVLDNLFYDVLNVEFNLWGWVRGMLKYGDFFLKLEISEKFGIYNVIPYSVYHVARYEGTDPEEPTKVFFMLEPDGLASQSDPNYLPKNGGKTGIRLENYEVAHFRLLTDTNYLPYGRSYIEPARKIFKQLTLCEDAALIHRIMRAPEKRIFYINVGQIPPNEVEQFMQKTVNTMKKTPYVGPDGQYNLRFNMQNMMEDFYIPVRGGDTSTKVETTPGLNYDGIQDIRYYQEKLFAALKIPKAYIGYEGELSGKATLSAEDIRFARTVERIQKIIESELTKIALVHLYTQGFTGESLANFELKLTTPSVLFEQEKIALLKEKVDLADQMINTKLFSSDYIFETIFGLSEEDYITQRDLVREDAKRAFRLSQIENEGNDPAKSGRSYGTPHDLASMYGRRSSPTAKGAGAGEVPTPYEDMPRPHAALNAAAHNTEGGRPRIRASFKGTQEDPAGGADPMGRHGMHQPYKSDYEYVMEQQDRDLHGRQVEPEFFEEKKKHVDFLSNVQMLQESNIDQVTNILDHGPKVSSSPLRRHRISDMEKVFVQKDPTAEEASKE